MSDFRVVTVALPGLKEEAIDCVLLTTTAENRQAMGTRLRMTREAAEALLLDLQEAVQRVRQGCLPPKGTTAH
ncbi:MAG: hypothetical protein EON56_06155 [Alphaproteobacteria bacterium]|nr:MAG: hypothetical protein EON56_06155 [Alphaproteobacteria bacterium]